MADKGSNPYSGVQSYIAEADRIKALHSQAIGQLKSSGYGLDVGSAMRYFWDYNRPYYDLITNSTPIDKLDLGSIGNVETLVQSKIASLESKAKMEEEAVRQKQIVATQGILGRGSFKKGQLSMFSNTRPQEQVDIFQDKGILQPTIPQNSIDLLG